MRWEFVPRDGDSGGNGVHKRRNGANGDETEKNGVATPGEGRRSDDGCAGGRGSVSSFVCGALVSAFSLNKTMVRVGAVGNRALCGFPSRGGRGLGVHGDGSVHARVMHVRRSVR